MDSIRATQEQLPERTKPDNLVRNATLFNIALGICHKDQIRVA
jgi:hypothetical protein